MLSTQDAFRKFRSKLELNTKEQEDASRRQKEVRGVMDDAFEIDHDFLTGSYARWTKTKPLKDVDIFCVLAKKHRDYRDKQPSVLLADVEKALAKKYGNENVSQQRRSCTVQFGPAALTRRVIIASPGSNKLQSSGTRTTRPSAVRMVRSAGPGAAILETECGFEAGGIEKW